MPGWIVTVVLAGVIALIVAALGGTDELIIMLVVLAWFVVLAAFALAVEMGVQAVGRLMRRSG